MEKLDVCAVCKKQIANNVCKICGQNICDAHFDKKNNICISCKQGKQ